MADESYFICPKIRLNAGDAVCGVRNTPCLGEAYRLIDEDDCHILTNWKKEEKDRKILLESFKENNKLEKGSLINIQLKACSTKEMTDLVTALENAGYRVFVETANFDFETGGQYYIKVGGVELL